MGHKSTHNSFLAQIKPGFSRRTFGNSPRSGLFLFWAPVVLTLSSSSVLWRLELSMHILGCHEIGSSLRARIQILLIFPVVPRAVGGWVRRCPESWLNVILGESGCFYMRVTFELAWVKQIRLNKEHCPLKCGWASCNLLVAWIEQKSEQERMHSLC